MNTNGEAAKKVGAFYADSCWCNGVGRLYTRDFHDWTDQLQQELKVDFPAAAALVPVAEQAANETWDDLVEARRANRAS